MAQPCSEADLTLVEAAHRLLAARYRKDRHEIAAALRIRDGRVFAAVNVDTRLRRMGVCAEVIAVGMAAAAGDTRIEAIVAVNREGRVVSPCGACREMIADYAPDARVVVPGEEGPEEILAAELLPMRYRKDGLPPRA
jgi:cytidine deaminase